MAVAAGCESPASPSAPRASASAAAVPTTSGPNGAFVIRGTTPGFIIHVDTERDLMAVHAPSNVCGGGSLNTLTYQRVVTPSQIGQAPFNIRSVGPVALYNTSSLAEAGFEGGFDTAGLTGLVDLGKFCAFLTGEHRIAEGDVLRTSSFTNANFSATWRGTVQDLQGGTLHLTEVYELTGDAHDPNNPATWSVNVSKILLH